MQMYTIQIQLCIQHRFYIYFVIVKE